MHRDRAGLWPDRRLGLRHCPLFVLHELSGTRNFGEKSVSTRRSFLTGLLLCPICAGPLFAEQAHWTYEAEHGPEAWGKLDKAFGACSVGDQQSPIDLAGGIKADLPDLGLDWKPQAYVVTNNGHTIQAEAAPGSSLKLDGDVFGLVQFHFHTPSEHALKGKRSALEAHFVHANGKGQLAVVGMLMKAGRPNASFAAVMAAAPKQEGRQTAPAPIDPNLFLPADRGFFCYEGSLTIPPCSETVNWNVFRQEIEVAEADINAFRVLYPMNARPLQPVNRRFLLRNS